jgi:hypothetical protein
MNDDTPIDWSGSFQEAVEDACDAAEWEIDEIDDLQACIKYVASSGALFAVQVVCAEARLLFILSSKYSYDSEDDVPHPISTTLLLQNSGPRIGWWCMNRQDDGQCTFMLTHEEPFQDLDVSRFIKIIQHLAAELDEFETAINEAENDD